MDCRHTGTCYLKLKLNRKISLSHNWAVVARIMRSNNAYALRNAISQHFHCKINNNRKRNKTAKEKKKSANALNLTAKFECDMLNSFRQIDVSF